MADTNDYLLIRAIKLAVYRITEGGDQIEIHMINKPEKAVSYKILDTTALTDIPKVRITIEAEAKKIGLLAIQDRN